MKRRINSLIQSLVLIRFGQEIGSSGRLATALAGFIDALLSALG